jgi:outer membrane lipoprotein-sorting protein
MKKIFVIVWMSAIIVMPMVAAEPTAAELLAGVDNNEVYDTIVYEGEMIIEYQGKRFVKTMKAWARSNNDSFVEFTNREDAGTKYLKKDGRLYVYSPDTEQTILISGQMLKQSMMGSDMSYEDVIENSTLTMRYTPLISGSQLYNGKECWVLELTAKKKTESYAKRKLWIEKDTRDLAHYELYALSGAKLKEYTLGEVKVFGSRRFPVKSEMSDQTRKNSRTTFIMNNVQLDTPLADSVFSQRNLEK